jgi:predicted dehydrogenase
MINLGIAGMGYIGRIHLEAAQKVSGAQVLAVATQRAAELRDAFPGIQVYPTFHELFLDDRLDAVIICLPTYLHEVATVEAAERGLHVLCEKAMALDAISAERMLAAARAHGCILMVAHVLRFWPQYARIKALVEAGDIGAIRSVTAWRLGKYPPWGTWFRDPAKSGGCLLDLQIHDVDFIFWILGRPQSVYTVGIQSPTGSWDHVHTMLNYPQAQASVEASYLMPESWPFTTSIRVLGDEGALEYEFRVGSNIQQREQASHIFRRYTSTGTASDIPTPDEDMFSAQLRYFLSCVAERQPPRLCPPEETCRVMQVMTASRQSADSGRVIALDEAHGSLA